MNSSNSPRSPIRSPKRCAAAESAIRWPASPPRPAWRSSRSHSSDGSPTSPSGHGQSTYARRVPVSTIRRRLLHGGLNRHGPDRLRRSSEAIRAIERSHRLAHRAFTYVLHLPAMPVASVAHSARTALRLRHGRGHSAPRRRQHAASASSPMGWRGSWWSCRSHSGIAIARRWALSAGITRRHERGPEVPDNASESEWLSCS